MLPQIWRGDGSRGRSGAELDRMRHRAVASDARMLEARQDALRRHLWMLEHVLDRARRRAGNTLAEQGLPFDGGSRLERRADLGQLAVVCPRFLTVSKRGSLASSDRPVSSHSAVQKCGVLAEM